MKSRYRLGDVVLSVVVSCQLLLHHSLGWGSSEGEGLLFEVISSLEVEGAVAVLKYFATC